MKHHRGLWIMPVLISMLWSPGGAAAAGRAPKANPAAATRNLPFWTGKPDSIQFETMQQQRLATAKALIAKVKAVQGARTLANTLQPYDEALRELDMAGSQSNLVSETNPDASLRSVGEKMVQETAAFGTELSLDRGVYDALSALDLSGVDGETKHFVTRTLRDFRLAGVDKDEETRKRIRALSEEIVEIGQEFSRNIREDKRKVTATVAELAGLPDDFIRRHETDGEGRVTLTTEYPDAIPIMAYATSGELRQRMYMEYNNRAFPKNLETLDRLRAKRHELANLLGFTNWADFVTADKMVGSAKNAREFIDRVVAASADRQAREYQQLLARKQKDVPGATAVEFWEQNYYSELVKKSDYDFDSQSIRPYFPYTAVKQGMLDFTEKLFGVDIRPVPDAPVWHPAVECYELFDGGKLAGRFYLDMHPRENKYNHAAQFDIRTGVLGAQVPEAALVCNFPGGEAGDPGLMEFNDVSTFYHEFGHLLHTMFAGHHRWMGIGGIRTEQDFVEAPSQMLEEFVKSYDVLKTFAKHHETGEVIPEALVKQMNRANDFGKGLQVRRQMVYAGTSLGYYDRNPAGVNTTEFMKGLVQKYQPFPFVDGTHFQCAFGHLEGYSAVYYTYMWSLVIAKDLFAQFDTKHLWDPVKARAYRDAVLAPGGSKPAAQLVADFIGRPFNEVAWKGWLDKDE